MATKKRFLDKIKEGLAKEGFAARTKEARAWLTNKVREIRFNESAKMGFVNLSNKSKIPNKSGLTIGKMYFYFYDPKTKDHMPYYDIFPLVIPIDYMPAKKSATRKDPGFLGLNLHYIPPRYRISLLDKLYDITNNNAYNETTKIMLRYRTLLKTSTLFEATPCLKWYLFKQVRSRVLEIDADEWEIAALLPFESFQKQSKQKVWNDSRKKF